MSIRCRLINFVLMIAVLAMSAPALAKTDTVYKELSPEMVKLVAEGMKISCTQSTSEAGLPMLVLDYGKFKTLMLFYNPGPMLKATSLGLTTVFNATDFKFKDINAWNANGAYSRAYLTDEGWPAIAADLYVQSGVTEAGLRNFLATFKGIVQSYIKHLNDSRKTN